MPTDHVPAAQSIPEALREREQWVYWRTEHRDGEQTKVPVEPVAGGVASTSDPDSWSTFGVARGYATADDTAVDGVGIVFTAEDPLVGVDLDGCRDPDTGSLDEPAVSIVDRLESYTEVSRSGTGVHVLLRGAPGGAQPPREDRTVRPGAVVHRHRRSRGRNATLRGPPRGDATGDSRRVRRSRGRRP